LYRKLPKVNLSRSLGRELNTRCPLYQPYGQHAPRDAKFM